MPEGCPRVGDWAGVVLKTNMADDIMEYTDMKHKTSRPFFKLFDAKGENPRKPVVPKTTLPRRRSGRVLAK